MSVLWHSGKKERLPYSLSRWTDIPIAKWPWFEQQLKQGWFVGFDPRTAIPGKWSLTPENTFGLVFWTKDPTNLVAAADRLKDFPLVIHMTLTGWEEVEKGAPNLQHGVSLMRQAIEEFGPERVVWRFSPVPLVEDSIERFETIAAEARRSGLKEVFISFLQENDFLPETRSRRVRLELMKQMAMRAPGLTIKLCAEDQSIASEDMTPRNLTHGVCESGHRFVPSERSNYLIEQPKTEGCGCALAVDPFTIQEACTLGCRYCYAADKTLSPRKRNTTKHSLKVVP